MFNTCDPDSNPIWDLAQELIEEREIALLEDNN